MFCSPVRRDGPGALASGISTVQVDKLWPTHLFHDIQCRIARYCMSRAKDLGPVVQSIISLTSSLRGQLVKCFTTF